MTRTSSSATADPGPGLIVALVGVDGVGKSTVARRLVDGGPWPCCCVYMGPSLGSGNVLLPTSRLVRALRRRRSTGPRPAAGRGPAARRRGPARGGAGPTRVRWLAGATNRVAEGLWRRAAVRRARARGAVVVYDRYPPFETAMALSDPWRRAQHGRDRVEGRVLARLVPAPDLVVHLDAPSVVVRARKPEVSLRRLERWRGVVDEVGRAWAAAGDRRFVRVDADRPVDLVVADVVALVDGLRRGERADPDPVAAVPGGGP